MRVLSPVLVLLLASCAGSMSDGGAGGDAAGGDGGGADGGGGSGSSDPGPVTGEDPSVAGIVAAHNAARAAVQPAPATPLPALAWSDAAFDTASAWAANCRFDHNPDRDGFGENIYATSGTATAQDVVASWVSEKSDYDYATNSCRTGLLGCGHYSQVVWRSTTSIGCAAKICTSGSPWGAGSWQFWVCNYAPAGNREGERPY